LNTFADFHVIIQGEAVMTELLRKMKKLLFGETPKTPPCAKQQGPKSPSFEDNVKHLKVEMKKAIEYLANR
jgi:hypothetical protein